MSSSSNHSYDEEVKSNSSLSSSRDHQEYRMVRKAYMCHLCEREFKQMAPVNELVEVECPTCHQNFVEEVSSASESLIGSHGTNFASSGSQTQVA